MKAFFRSNWIRISYKVAVLPSVFRQVQGNHIANETYSTIYFNSFHTGYRYILTSDHGFCRSGTDISVHSYSLHCDCSYSEQKRVRSQLLATTTSWMCQLKVAPTCWQFSTGFDTHVILSELLQNSWSKAESVLSTAGVKWVKIAKLVLSKIFARDWQTGDVTDIHRTVRINLEWSDNLLLWGEPVWPSGKALGW